ncbi:hypothetical protein EUTSA_v10022217mg, partial [Eutrema salsugineum]
AKFTFFPPIPKCCRNLKMDKMFCFCEAVIQFFSQLFNINKLGLINHACGDVLTPGWQCGVYTIPDGS